MENENMIGIKKGTSIRDVILMIIFGIGGMALFFSFVQLNAQDAGVTIDQDFNNTIINLTNQQNQVVSLTDDLQMAASNLTEAKIGDFAFFGLRGILKLMQLPLTLLSVVPNAWRTLSVLLPLPDALKFIILTGFVVFILFAIIKFISSRATEA